MSGPAESSQGFFSRRSFFRFSRSLAAGLGLAPLISSAKGLSSVVTSPAEKEGEDYYAKLGVRTIINAAGTYTTLTAACMPPEVLAAVQKAALHPVRSARFAAEGGRVHRAAPEMRGSDRDLGRFGRDHSGHCCVPAICEQRQNLGYAAGDRRDEEPGHSAECASL